MMLDLKQLFAITARVFEGVFGTLLVALFQFVLL
jgi:hypothetical protein